MDMQDPFQLPLCFSGKPADRSGQMPEPGIKLIQGIVDGDLPVSSCKGCDDCDHLILPDTRLNNLLIVSYAGIGFVDPNDSVQYISAVISPVKGNVIFFQRLTDRGKGNGINTLSDHRKHTDTFRREVNILPGGKTLLHQSGKRFHMKNTAVHSHYPFLCPSSIEYHKGVHPSNKIPKHLEIVLYSWYYVEGKKNLRREAYDLN